MSVSVFREPTKAQWASFLAAWAGWVLDAFDFTIFLVVMPKIASDFHVSITSATWTVTATLLLRLVGGVIAGAAADKWGRKLPLMISVFWFAACDGAIAFAPSFAAVLVLRTLFGLGMGAEWASGATLAMENWPARTRGLASGVLQGSWAVGYLLAAQVSSFVFSHGGGWRTLFLLAAAPAVLVLPIRIWVPDSHPSHTGARADDPSGEVSSTDTKRRLGWGCFYMALAFGAYYALSALYSTFVQKDLHGTVQDAGTLLTYFNVGMLAGAVACGYAASRWGAPMAIMACSAVTIVILPLYVGWVPGTLALGAVLGGMFGGGYAGVCPLMLTQMFPARVRGRAVGLVFHVGACFAAFVPTVVSHLTEHEGLTFAQSIAFVTGGLQLALGLSLVLRPRGIFEPRAESPSLPGLAVSELA